MTQNESIENNKIKGNRPDRALSMLGIAAKAGKVVSGEFATENAVKSANAFLVVVAEDASENTKKKFRDMTSYYEVPMELYGTKETLGGCIGKDYRSSLAVTDEKLADAVRKKLLLVLETGTKGTVER